MLHFGHACFSCAPWSAIESSPTFRPRGASGSRSPCSFRRRGAHRVAEAAILARCLPAVTGRTQRLPPGPVPEHRFIAAVRIDVVDDRCRTDHVMTTALDAERMRAQKCHPFGPPPLRAVKRADSRIPLAVMVPVALTLLTPSDRTVDGGSNGHGGDLDDANGWCRKRQRPRGSSPSQARYSREHSQNIPHQSRFCPFENCPPNRVLPIPRSYDAQASSITLRRDSLRLNRCWLSFRVMMHRP